MAAQALRAWVISDFNFAEGIELQHKKRPGGGGTAPSSTYRFQQQRRSVIATERVNLHHSQASSLKTSTKFRKV
jgi:hypothetical protein